jgi:Domain of unknown function (DUF4032)/Lipopolysaccharide kinase (Kdo/WaaP) family
MPTQLRIVKRGDHPDFLDLPWDAGLAEWDSQRLVRMVRGDARHVVRFVAFGDRVYALKETDDASGRREYDALLTLAERGLPAVEPVGLVTGRPLDGAAAAVLITRYLDYALPYRYLYGREGGPGLDRRLIDAAAVLLARLHLDGVYWGDCSLSNLLFRRDAGALAAYLVDAETAELHLSLAGELRRHDLDIAVENVAGGLADLVAAGEASVDPLAVARRLADQYTNLWSELTRVDEVDSGDRHLIDHRVRRLHELGFDVEELAIEAADSVTRGRLTIRPTVVEEGHHSRNLRRLTGLEVQENQARRLLDDIAAFGACLSRDTGADVPLAIAAARWLTEVYRPLVQRIPDDLRGRLEPPELFHELLEHRYYLSLDLGRDVGSEAALASYLGSILRGRPDERLLGEPEEP